MTTNAHGRGHSHADALADAKAMLAAAQADKEVAKDLGAAYLRHVHDDIAHAEQADAERPAGLGEAHEDGARVTGLGERLIAIMSTIRGRADLAGVSPAKREALGTGEKWKASMPDSLVTAARAMISALDADHALATQVHATPQVRHDLEHVAAALDDAHQHQHTLRVDNKNATAAGETLFATLRADAHHIRLAAHILHRGDPAKLAAFQSPVPQHVVTHRTPAPPAPAQ